MFGLSKIQAAVSVVALGLLVISVGLNGWQRAANATQRAQIAGLQASLATCSARIINIKEDVESDATVTDPNLFVVPDSWMRPVNTDN